MLNIPAVNVKGVDYAFDKLVTFNELNQTRDKYQDRIDALKLYCEGAGLEDEVIVHLFEQCEDNFSEQGASYVFVGVLVGLAIMEHQLDL